MLLKFWKTPEIASAVEYLFTEVTTSLQNGYSKPLLGKVLGGCANVLKEECTVNVLLGNMQKFWQPLFFENLISLFLEHQWSSLDRS